MPPYKMRLTLTDEQLKIYGSRSRYSALSPLGALFVALSVLLIAFVGHAGIRTISWAALVVLVAAVGGITGLPGLGVCAVATGIGLIPVLWGSRRMNAMGVLLLPIALQLSGAGAWIAGVLGLLDGT